MTGGARAAEPTSRSNRPALRRQAIARHVLANGTVTAAALAEEFGISVMTVHRDLDELERHGVVRKHRGGVTAQPSSVFESHLTYRMGQAAAAKAAIAREARNLVEPGMAVMLDDSTSVLALAHLLDEVNPLTVITNFVEVIRLATGWPGTRVIALGGEYNAPHDSFLGVPCIEALANLRVDVLFASTSTVSGGFVYHQEQEIVLVKRAMLTAAARKVLLVDSSKLGRLALHRLAPLSDFDVVITDDGADPEAVRQMREERVQVIVAAAGALAAAGDGPEGSTRVAGTDGAAGAQPALPGPRNSSRASARPGRAG
ncbi:MAG TPA: DeoR/GlpR family DNA-binding transcription regulator [Nakamurella sp.]|nr:DeoR/GlpR family DNA-binding transcription regulator [Nakamurella sp.]